MTALRTGLLAACGAAVLGAAVAIAPGAHAQDDVVASSQLPPAPVDFNDPNKPFQQRPAVAVSVRDQAPRFTQGQMNNAEGGRDYQLQVTANGDSVGVPINMSIAQRGNFGADDNGDVNRQGHGQELRVGSHVSDDHRPAHQPGWYAFAASDDQAVTWTPGSHNAFGDHGSSFSLQDRVEIGDHQAGVTYETGNGVQASIAYVDRKVNAHVGNQSASHDESFAGVTVTMRH
ncbi:MAG: hypothetical protein ABUS48_05640 [Pseudomonadota bacterium]